MLKIRKIGLLLLLGMVAALSAASVSAWYSVNHEAEVTVSGIDGVFWVDVFAPCDAAPVLTPAELAERLPEEYLADGYRNAVNGVLDSDSYASVRLYQAGTTRVYDREDGSILFHFTTAEPASYKVAFIASDGAIRMSDVIVQTMFHTSVAIDQSVFSVSESNGFPHDVIIDESPSELPEILLFVAAMVLSIFAVLLMLRAFGYRSGKTFVAVGLFNAAVVGVVVLLLAANPNLGFPLLGALTVLFLVLVVFGQMILLSLSHPELQPSRALAYAFLANVILGLAVLYFQTNLLWFFAL
jgi:hypothetical protein